MGKVLAAKPPDVNVLLAAHRTDHPDYGLARPCGIGC